MTPKKRTPLQCALDYVEARSREANPDGPTLLNTAANISPHKIMGETCAEACARIITEDYRAVTALNARLQVQLTALLEELPVEEREKILAI